MKTFRIEKVKFENKRRGSWTEYVIFLNDSATGKDRAIAAINEEELCDFQLVIDDFMKSELI
jgi:hypothetical protein